MDVGARPIRLGILAVSALIVGALFAPAAVAEPEPGTYSSSWLSSNSFGYAPPTLQLGRVDGRVVPEYMFTTNKPGEAAVDCSWSSFKPSGRYVWYAHQTSCTPNREFLPGVTVTISGVTASPVTGRLTQESRESDGRVSARSADFRAHVVLVRSAPPVPLCGGYWTEPGRHRSIGFDMEADGTLLNVTWDRKVFHAGKLKSTGASHGTVATFDLVRAGQPAGREWLDFYASGEHGDRVDRAYIRRSHITLNPFYPVHSVYC